MMATVENPSALDEAGKHKVAATTAWRNGSGQSTEYIRRKTTRKYGDALPRLGAHCRILGNGIQKSPGTPFF